jgi:DNA repair exonuclease SbcCD ATPase subunit
MHQLRLRWTLAAVLLVVVGLEGGCRSTYYSAWETLGKHKRDLLRDRVDAGRKDQREAEEQFQTTYERFKELSGYDGGELEQVYNKLNREYEECEQRAEDVRDRIKSIEQVAADLFEEWEQEIGLIQNAALRRDSQSKLRATEERYGRLVRSMKLAETKMEPVLVAFRDHVLYLKHNLNASAVAALEGTAVEIQRDIDVLIRDLRASITEADRFLEALEHN